MPEAKPTRTPRAPKVVVEEPVPEPTVEAPIPEITEPVQCIPPARWSRASILGFALAVTPPLALVGAVCSVAAFQRSERLGLRGGTLSIAGVVIGTISAMATVITIVFGLLFAHASLLTHEFSQYGQSNGFGQSSSNSYGESGSWGHDSNRGTAATPVVPDVSTGIVLTNGMTMQDLKDAIDTGSMTSTELESLLPAGVTFDDVISQLNSMP